MANYQTMLAGLEDLINNPTPRVPVALCLDVSGSMNGMPIDQLNQGVQQYLKEMKDDDLTRYGAETAVVTFASQAQCVADFALPDNLNLPKLQANGYTAMGEGLQMAMELLQRRKKKYQGTGVDYYQPILVVMSDGAPNGDPRVLSNVIDQIRQQVAQRRLTVIPVGIGAQADMQMLAKLSPNHAPVQMSALCFREFFAWLSRSVSAVSASVPGDELKLDLEALEQLAVQPWPEAL